MRQDVVAQVNSESSPSLLFVVDIRCRWPSSGQNRKEKGTSEKAKEFCQGFCHKQHRKEDLKLSQHDVA